MLDLWSPGSGKWIQVVSNGPRSDKLDNFSLKFGEPRPSVVQSRGNSWAG